MSLAPDAAPHRDVVVIGASAGGVTALQGLLRALPAETCATLLIVLHLPEGYVSQLALILRRATKLPVENARDGQRLEARHVYIAVPGHHLTLERDHIRLQQTPKLNGSRRSIDMLFMSAAAEYGPRVVGVVLSGTLHDGTEGLRHISAHGGITIVQDPIEAQHSGMPDSALLGNDAQYCLPVADIAALIARLADHRHREAFRR